MGDILAGIFGLILLYFIGLGAYYGAHAFGFAWYDPDTYEEMIRFSLIGLAGSLFGIFATIQMPVWFGRVGSTVSEQARRRKQAKLEAEEAAQKEAAISEAIRSSENIKRTSHQQSQFQKLSLSISSLHEDSLGLSAADYAKVQRDIAGMNDIVSDIVNDDLLVALSHASPDQFEDIKFHIEDIWENLLPYRETAFGRRFKRVILSKIEIENE